MSSDPNKQDAVSCSNPEARSHAKRGRISWRWMLLTVTLVLAAIAATSEVWARRELHRSDELGYACRDRSDVSFWIDEARLNPYVTHTDTNMLRITVIGDSFARGRDCFYTDTFGLRLESLLNINPDVRPVRVDVRAEAGTGTREQRRLLNQTFASGPSDLVILAYCLNDTEDWSKQDEFVQWRKLREPHSPGPVVSRLLRVSALADLCYRQANDRHSLAGTQSLYCNLYAPSYTGRQRMEQAMAYFRDVCSTNNAKLLVVMLPMFEIGDAASYRFATDAVRQVTTKLGVPFFDTWPAFEGRSALRMTTRPGIDGHLSEIAHRIVAEEIFMYLLANGMVDPAYIPIHKSTKEAAFEASLARYRTSPQKP